MPEVRSAMHDMIRLPRALTALLVAALLTALAVRAQDALTEARRRMVQDIAEMAAATADETGRVSLDRRVIDTMLKVPRHLFVSPEQERSAYQNRPLPIGHGQTISQPYIVALMTDLMRLQPGDVVLEIGTGSGYQAAVAAQLARAVYSIEIVEPLGREAQERLRRLGYRNVEVKVADGYYGWDEHAPFDAIIVTAAGSHVPPPLVRQLRPGGRMVIPVGAQFLTQYLMLVEKQPDGSVVTRQVLPVHFVPLTGAH
jgi:protein-L-isoaspartate(D-aspartate) O-methyltransferase